MDQYKKWQQRALANARLGNAQNLLQTALREIEKAIAYNLEVERVMSHFLTEAAPPSQTELRIEPLAD